jgi:hypothetical protein
MKILKIALSATSTVMVAGFVLAAQATDAQAQSANFCKGKSRQAVIGCCNDYFKKLKQRGRFVNQQANCNSPGYIAAIKCVIVDGPTGSVKKCYVSQDQGGQGGRESSPETKTGNGQPG